MKKFCLILFCLFGLPFHFFAQDQVHPHLEYLTSNQLAGRETGTEGIHLAATYIENVFKKNKVQALYTTYRDSFDIKKNVGYNIIGLVEGSDAKLKDELILIGAHYDHIGVIKAVAGDSIANGANDNASGTVAVMELAKHFAKNPPKRSLVFVLFAAEEMGLVGSKHLAKRMKKENQNIYAVFNIEMIGVAMKNKSFSAYMTGFEMSNFAEKFNAYAGAEVLGFLPEAKNYQLFKRSDNYPFYQEFKVPSQTVSTFDFTNYDYYHHVNDEAAELDIQHIQSLIEAFIPGLEGMANADEKEIKLN